jgi:hypothetical protein
MRHRMDSGIEVAGLVALRDDTFAAPDPGGPPLLGTLRDLDRIARAHRIHSVIFAPESVQYETVVGAIAGGLRTGLEFKMVPRDLDVIIGSSSIDSLEDIPLVDLDYKIFTAPNRAIKRAFDLAAVLALSPALVFTLLLALFRPGCRFRGALMSGWPDRSIRVRELWINGRPAAGWLGILPRFWDVLRGRYSLVGMDIRPFEPGAEPLGFKPGLTGLVQVNRSKGLNPAEADRYRLYYLKNYSLLLDLEILFKAVFRL